MLAGEEGGDGSSKAVMSRSGAAGLSHRGGIHPHHVNYRKGEGFWLKQVTLTLQYQMQNCIRAVFDFGP
jgi:hypothetical protein